MDHTLLERLDRWCRAGLLTEEQAERIRQHEEGAREQEAGDPATAAAGRPRSRVTGPTEAVGYVGASLALGAIVLILGDLWLELVTGGRLALAGVLTLAVLGAGVALRGAQEPAVQRLVSVLFGATVAGVGWFTAVIAIDVVSLGWDDRPFTISAVMALVALPLYLVRRRGLPLVVLLATLAVAAGSFLDPISPLQPGIAWRGALVAAVGAGAFLASQGGWLVPRAVGEVAATVITFFGIQLAAFGDAGSLALTVGVLLAVALVILALRTDVLHHLVVSALALFVLAPQLVFDLFGDAIGAPATLLLVGLLLVLLAVGLGRAGREVRQPTEEESR